MITICYPPGAGGFFLHSLFQLAPSVCSCVQGADFWRSGSTNFTEWISAEHNINHPQCQCTGVSVRHCHAISHVIEEPTDRVSMREHIHNLRESVCVMDCSSQVWQWLRENEGKKPYHTVPPDHPDLWRPEYYTALAHRVKIVHTDLWSEAGIQSVCEQINHGFQLNIDPAEAVTLARIWWQRHHELGIEPPCV